MGRFMWMNSGKEKKTGRKNQKREIIIKSRKLPLTASQQTVSLDLFLVAALWRIENERWKEICSIRQPSLSNYQVIWIDPKLFKRILINVIEEILFGIESVTMSQHCVYVAALQFIRVTNIRLLAKCLSVSWSAVTLVQYHLTAGALRVLYVTPYIYIYYNLPVCLE